MKTALRKTAGTSALLLACACASIGNVQTADTLGRGHYQVGIEPGVQSLSAGNGSASALTYPHIDASFRYGITDSIDLGVRGGFSFLEAQGKFLFTKPGAPGIVVSLAPTIGGLASGDNTTGAGIINIGLPVLIGYKFEGGNEITLGPRVQNLLIFASSGRTGGAIYGMGLGSSLGYSIRFGDSFGLLPEIAFTYPLFLTAGVSGSAAQSAGLGSALLWQFKLGIMLGKQRDPKSNIELVQQPPPPASPPAYAPPPPRPANAPLPPEPQYAPYPSDAPPPPTSPPPPPPPLSP